MPIRDLRVTNVGPFDDMTCEFDENINVFVGPNSSASNLAEQPGIMIIDESDAHLHPTAQQRIIPVLRRHSPRMQIFCSAHSPLMLVNLQTGQIQRLQRDSQGTVTVSRNATAIVGRSTDGLLEQFFGIPTGQGKPLTPR